MSWQRAEAFVPQHEHPQGLSPGENHPPAYGKLKRSPVYLTDGARTIAVHSTPRRSDGWSYNVVQCKEAPWWFSYFHHARTGKRVRYSGTSPASSVERSWGLEQLWRDVVPL